MTRSADSLGNAREILLGKRSPTIKVLDRLLGAGILAAGPVGAATGQPWLLAAWGWVDQKNELVARLDELVAKGRGKLRRSGGHRRHEVLAATHAALAVAAFFTAVRDVVGPVYDELELSEDDLARLSALPGHREELGSLAGRLLSLPVRLPRAGCGFHENLDGALRPYYDELARRCVGFFAGLEAWRRIGHRTGVADELRDGALERYRAEYFRLAADVPEFRIWAVFGEHRAEQDALARLEELTRSLAGSSRVALEALRGINRAVLTSPIVNLDEATSGPPTVRVPTVQRGYVEPHFRWAVMGPSSRPAQEEWWQQQRRGTDLAGFVAAHVVSAAAAERPLVVLGHPGSGKSLFTKVCTARLSATDAVMTVRVPLRDVAEPTASVYRQIEDVLRESTHGRVEWRTLCEGSEDCLRVVLIDGLDELMQATGATESRYLRNVMDFQRTESAGGGPAAVIVTSRTLVADLAAIPEDCLVVRLEEFTDEQIGTWAERWAEANAGGASRPVEAARLREYGDLARQPLLLLLLAIVAAGRELPADGTTAALYRMLLDDFVHRELARPDNQAPGHPQEERVAAELWKLGLVAFGMLNRGRQHLAEHDLEADLRALPGPAATVPVRPRDLARPLGPARRVIGRFFFVVAAEADAGAAGRSYEFLHATFGDFLVAFQALELLRDAAKARTLRTASQVWDDDLLFALLSHTLLATAGSRTIDLFAEQARGDEAVAAVLEHIVSAAQHRWTAGRHAAYDPSGAPPVRRLATYTANAVALRLAMADGPVPLSRFGPPGAETGEWWSGQVRLWEAMLAPTAGWGPFISRLQVTDGEHPAAAWQFPAGGWAEDMVEIAALRTDRAMQLAAGRTVLHGSREDVHHPSPRIARDLALLLRRWLPDGPELAVLTAPGEIPPDLHGLASVVAARHGGRLDTEQLRELARTLGEGADRAHTDLLGGRRLFTIFANMMIDFSDHLESGDLRGIADTREGRALLALPPELARPLIPELVASLLSTRQQDLA
ncbi:NACHT domain-containing protein [Dactylosporangium sp. McL0621]|uniref:NACHT domain-containing protein n=1 Tax=Dactylosporangium sp. McL0621 TaxID=3415678 RepID=UPI003CF1C5A7